eukprot:5008552-Prymnesium_polylepis.2
MAPHLRHWPLRLRVASARRVLGSESHHGPPGLGVNGPIANGDAVAEPGGAQESREIARGHINSELVRRFPEPNRPNRSPNAPSRHASYRCYTYRRT